ncbi:MAG TPA: hypothetical protein P5250_05820, partial [Bacteroidales bacterium]|nr:hypothetical protein [Bacteroidales bacterium]
MNNIKYFLIKTYLILFNILLSLLLNAQPGKDGAKIVNNIEYINEYTLLSQDANQGSIIINVLSSSLNNNNRFAQNLSTGDLLFIIQIQGAIINYNNDINYGEIIDYESCGNYEFAQVDSVIDAFSIKLTCPITNNYKATGKTLIVRVPRLTSLTINNGGILTCDNWNGYSGGVLVAEILNDIILNSGGVIDVSGKGFRGGIKYDTISEWGVLDYRWYKKNTGGEKGESIAGYHYEYDNMGGRFCRGAPANGGGGGNAHNAGGGGGANAGNTTLWTGLGIPDISTPSWANAWNLEYPGFAYAISPGGGRGGYTFSSANLDALVEGTNGEWGNSNWGGDWRRATGGLGGRPLNYTTSKIFLGGGGGAGDENENYGGSGGNGGGLIYLFIQGNISGNGVILSNGSNGEDAIGPQPITGATGTDGAGGGGAGGTIIINSLGNISGISIYANGGKGGNQIIKKGLFSSNTEAEGPGGGGGGGYIATSLNSNNIIKQAAGGINGTTNSVGLTEFPPNGATKGCYGIDTAIITNYHLTTINDTVCKGNDAILRALLIGNPPSGISIEWYDKPINGNLIGLGDTLTIFNIDSTMTYWVGTCPGFYRIPVKAIVIEPKANAGADTSICFGNSLQLNATGGIYYQWSPITGLNDPYISNPIVSPLTSTNYTVTIYDKYGCTDKDSIYITVLAKPNANAGNDTSICQGQTLILNATGGILYHWAPETLVNNPYSNQTYTSPQATTIYTVTVTDINNCFEIDSIIVNVLQKPLLNLGNDTIICENDYLTLDVSNSGGSFYLWNNGNTNASIIINTQGTYSVIVTDTNGCTASDSINVSVLPLANITISDIAP